MWCNAPVAQEDKQPMVKPDSWPAVSAHPARFPDVDDDYDGLCLEHQSLILKDTLLAMSEHYEFRIDNFLLLLQYYVLM